MNHKFVSISLKQSKTYGKKFYIHNIYENYSRSLGFALQGKEMKWSIGPWNKTYLILESTTEWMTLSWLELGVLSSLNMRESEGEEGEVGMGHEQLSQHGTVHAVSTII